MPALLTVTAVFIGEWVAVLYEGLTAGLASPSAMTAFIVVTLGIGNFVVVNLFVAELVKAFVNRERERHHVTQLEQLQRGSVAAEAEVLAAPTEVEAATCGPSETISGSSDSEAELPMHGHTCFCCGPAAPWRRACRMVLLSEVWKGFVLMVVLVSCVCLAIDNPRVEPHSTLRQQLLVVDYAVTAFFALEALMKLFVCGLIYGPHSYFRSGWNCLDFVILIASFVSLVDATSSGGALRILRVLRPLRLVKRVPGMSVILTFFFESVADMANVLGVYLFFQLIFAVVGMQLFLDVEFEDAALSFTSIGPAMMLLFVIATGDAWEDVMWSAMDASGWGQPPRRNDDSMAAFFFIVWVFIGHFVLVNFFVATVVNNFVRIKEEHDHAGSGGVLLTDEQRQWQLVALAAREHERATPKPPPLAPEGAVRAFCFRLVQSHQFSILTTMVVLFNIVVMASSYYGMEANAGVYMWYTRLMAACTNFYYAECIVKLVGLGFSGYFDDAWNQFDFSLVVTALLEQFAAEAVERYLPVPPMLLRVMRIARVLRAVRLLRQFAALRNVIMTLLLSIPSFVNVGFCLSLVIFMYGVLGLSMLTLPLTFPEAPLDPPPTLNLPLRYAVLGVQLFGNVREGGELQGVRSFQTVPLASELLLQCLTSDGWGMLMLDTRNSPERGNCDPSRVPTDCGSPAAFVYFISYQLIAMLVLLNLIVAIILQNFSALGDINPHFASKADIEEFDDAWHRIDTEGSGYIVAESLAELLLNLSRPLRPLGIPKGDTRKHRALARRQLGQMVEGGLLPRSLQSGFLEYRKVLHTLIEYTFNHCTCSRGPRPAAPSSPAHRFAHSLA